MSTTIRKRLSPVVDVPAAAGAHVSNELAKELNKIGTSVLTCAIGGTTVLIEHGEVLLPVPAGTAAGTPLYATGTTIANGSTVQAFGPNYYSTAYPSTLTATATGNTLIGTTTGAAQAYGLTTAAFVELAPQ